MSSRNVMSSVAQLALQSALLETAARLERETRIAEQNLQASERLSAVFGELVTVDASFTFEFVDG